MSRSAGTPVWGVPEVRVLAWGALVNGIWEFLQSPLYVDHGRGTAYLLWTRLHCTGGDALILLGAFWGTSLLFRGRFWWQRPRRSAVLLFTLLGLAYTVWSEWFNIGVRGAWAYAPEMPLVLGLGLTPLLQWVLLPPAVVALVRRSAPGGWSARIALLGAT